MRVGLVVNRVEDYALPLAQGLAEALGEAGSSLLVLVHPSTSDAEVPWLRRLVRAGTVDAVVLTSVLDPATGEALLPELIAACQGVPVVTLGGAGHGVPDVSCDNGAGAAAAAEHLLAAGRRRHLVVAGPEGNSDGSARETAYLDTLAAAGITADEVPLVRAGFSREVAFRRVLELLDGTPAGAPACDAVFAANDEMALGALDALSLRGLRVPDDVAVVGFDNIEAAAVSRPSLSSLDQQLHEQGRQAASLVLAQLAGRSVPESLMTAARLVPRDSSTTLRSPGDLTTEELAVLRGAHTELSTTRQLLALNHGLLGAATEDELCAELTTLVPRVEVRRLFLSRITEGTAELLFCAGAPGVDADRSEHAPERLLPPAHTGQLDTGTLVVHLLAHGGQETGLLVYEQDVLDRWTGQALQQGLASALAALTRTEELTEHAADLERLVASRTAQLQAEVTSRRAAQEQLQQANSRLHAALLVDGLTGVANRTAFDEALERAWWEHERTGRPVSVLMGDVDRFKLYNDSAGHLAGDACLRAVAGCIAEAVRGRDDVVARFGGEEFAVVLPGTDAAGAREVALRVLARVRDAALPHPGLPAGSTVSLSVGAATSALPVSLAGPADLVHRADEALYRAKTAGRDRVAGDDDDAAAAADSRVSRTR